MGRVQSFCYLVQSAGVSNPGQQSCTVYIWDSHVKSRSFSRAGSRPWPTYWFDNLDQQILSPNLFTRPGDHLQPLYRVS